MLAAIFKAVLSVSKGTLEEFTLYDIIPPRKGYRLILDHPVVLDRMHAEALIPYVGEIIPEDDDP